MILRLLWRLLGKSGTQRPDLHFVVYSREECPLCDEAWAILSKQQKSRGFSLKKINVDNDQALLAQHGHSVPVVVVNGQERFRGHVNEVLLRRLLNAKA